MRPLYRVSLLSAGLAVLLYTVAGAKNASSKRTDEKNYSSIDSITKDMLPPFLQSSLSFFGVDAYRLNTRLNALYALFSIDDATIDSYMDSYILFDGDWSNDNGKNEDNIIDYYQVLNHLCALGNVEKMYIPPLRNPNVGITANQELFELKMVADIQAFGSHKKVLDVGCGRGRIAMHTARVTGAHVSGINLDPSQIANAKNFAERTGLKDQTHFQVSSLNDPLPFPDETFDAGYEVQAFTYAKDKDAVFREIYRVLKPGARFSYLDWVLLDNYDPNNATHVDHVRRTMPFIGAVDNPRYQEIEKAMENAGFQILSEDASIGGHQAPLINMERRTYWWLRFLARAFLPKKFMMMLRRLREDAESFVAADELRIATTSYQIVCEKPLKEKPAKVEEPVEAEKPIEEKPVQEEAAEAEL
jgi:sterol 24-C-methyltransferase